MLKITFKLPGGRSLEVGAKVGERILDIAQANDLPMEGACEGSLACSTCHVLVDEAWFSKLAPASDEEEDMLDLTKDVTATSRLGCQIEMTPDLDGLVIELPNSTYNLISE